MVDEKVIAEVVAEALDGHLRLNGNRVQKNLWVRFVIQLVIVAVVISGLYFGLRSDVDGNAEAIFTESARSKKEDAKMDNTLDGVKLEINTVAIQQKSVIAKQADIGRDIDKIADKVDMVLDRLPKK